MSVRPNRLALIAALPFALLAGAVHAGSFSSACASQFAAVETAIIDATFFEPKALSNETNLLAKLDAAEAKVLQDKPGDAIDKLMSISDSATALATAPKPKLDDASGINQAVGAALACVGGL